MNNLLIKWDHLDPITIELFDNPVSDKIYSKFKYLGQINLNIPNHPRDNPYSNTNQNINDATSYLFKCARLLNLDLDENRILTQDYLNYLHEVYEKNYNGDPLWLEFHEMIHTNEVLQAGGLLRPIAFDYRERNGPLIEDFDRMYLQYSTTSVSAGCCYIKWQELSKDPYDYYIRKEPNNIDRLKELSKPWLNLKPNIFVQLTDTDFIKGKDILGFNKWFEIYKSDWTSHWQLDNWSVEEIFSVIPVGKVTDINELINRYKQNNYPTRIVQQK